MLACAVLARAAYQGVSCRAVLDTGQHSVLRVMLAARRAIWGVLACRAQALHACVFAVDGIN